MAIKITNDEFLTALFGEEKPWVHVTDFRFDPGQIPKEQHLKAWKGDYFSRYRMGQGTNQYFTISLFYCDENQVARRRKALFRNTPVIVLDDVKEKLSMSEVEKLPSPSWILETSQGSEQWGYILDVPCEDRGVVENLLDGLVANGLAPEGRDPGMKGVTRYVRLPEGYNHKQSKSIGGKPWQCQMTLWEPFTTTTIEKLAAPFLVDLHAPRREARVDGAEAIGDHPLINIPEIITIKEVRSDGRFDITCPWVDGHTGAEDSGTAVFTNGDGSIGFKCHHGHCQHRTAGDLLRYIDSHSAGFSTKLRNWQLIRDMKEVAEISFIGDDDKEVETVSFFGGTEKTVEVAEEQPEEIEDGLQILYDKLRTVGPSTKESQELCEKLLKHVDSLTKIEQKTWHSDIAHHMSWTKVDLKEILSDLRKQWYGEKVNDAEFYDNVVFVKELNQFYDWKSRIFFSAEAFQNSFSHEDHEARKIALQEGRVKKVDRMDYCPKRQRIFDKDGLTFGNLWSDESQSDGEPGNIDKWLQHFNELGWEEHAEHVIKWMAFTLRHPDVKINHILLFGGKEGIGKDFLLYPLIRAMGDNHKLIAGHELSSQFNDYVLATKYLHVNETELGDHREAKAISNSLKPLATSPPETLSVNQKGIKRIDITNIVNVTMTTNSLLPLRINGASRRFYAMWSYLNILDENDNVKPFWQNYWDDRWGWMKEDNGWKHVVHYLINEVDLSDFKPRQTPPMTEFLREIKEHSRSPMHQTLDLFMEKRHGVFEFDLATSSEISETFRKGAIYPTDMLTDSRHFSPKRVAMMLMEDGHPQIRDKRARLWVLRNHDRYKNMTTGEIFREYENSRKERESKQQEDNGHLKAVK